jgi:hypothetical protein
MKRYTRKQLKVALRLLPGFYLKNDKEQRMIRMLVKITGGRSGNTIHIFWTFLTGKEPNSLTLYTKDDIEPVIKDRFDKYFLGLPVRIEYIEKRELQTLRAKERLKGTLASGDAFYFT